VVNYLTDVPTLEELQILLGKLQIEPMELVRENEKIWIEKYKGTPLTDIEIIKAMVANPILIERPIIVNGDRAIIGRPIENIKRIL
jgi:arsenate reductase